MAPTSHPKDEAASIAVLAEVFKTITVNVGSKAFNTCSTLFTGSLYNKLIIQLKIVSFFLILNIQLCEICIGVIN